MQRWKVLLFACNVSLCWIKLLLEEKFTPKDVKSFTIPISLLYLS